MSVCFCMWTCVEFWGGTCNLKHGGDKYCDTNYVKATC